MAKTIHHILGHLYQYDVGRKPDQEPELDEENKLFLNVYYLDKKGKMSREFMSGGEALEFAADKVFQPYPLKRSLTDD